jgi:hypothetical protein
VTNTAMPPATLASTCVNYVSTPQQVLGTCYMGYGQPCTSYTQCTTGVCNDGSGQNQECGCANYAGTYQNGAPCVSDTDCSNVTCTNNPADQECDNGVCAIKIGGSCVTGGHLLCVGDLGLQSLASTSGNCTANTCVATPGNWCMNDNDCNPSGGPDNASCAYGDANFGFRENRCLERIS